MLAPRSGLERRIMQDACWREGGAWGAPRSGHPEGSVVRHIMDVLHNIDLIEEPGRVRDQLRLIALVHDALKYQVDRSRPRGPENDHAVLARKFADQYTADPQVLLVIETHDDAYRAWKLLQCGEPEAAVASAQALIDRLTDHQALQLYRLFYQADNDVSGKTREHRDWFSALCQRPSMS